MFWRQRIKNQVCMSSKTALHQLLKYNSTDQIGDAVVLICGRWLLWKTIDLSASKELINFRKVHSNKFSWENVISKINCASEKVCASVFPHFSGYKQHIYLWFHYINCNFNSSSSFLISYLHNFSVKISTWRVNFRLDCLPCWTVACWSPYTIL